jgi:hypothetical protein
MTVVDGCPCFVTLHLGNTAGDENKHYGPFASAGDAVEWIAQQSPHCSFSIASLRTPNKERGQMDFFLPTRIPQESDWL